MSNLSTDPYKGVRDFYPTDWAKMEAMFATTRKVLHEWGYEEYNASPLERAELYETKTSDEIVSEQTYTFTDRGDRRVTLRPEMTPTLARMVAAKHRELSFPLRWFSIPNLFRYERPQRGRLREHYQVNVDIVGLPEGEADLEIISVGIAILTSFGAKTSDFVIRINSRSLLNAACMAAGLKGDTVKHYLQLLDHKPKMPLEEFITARSALTDKDPLIFIEKTCYSSEITFEKEKLFVFLKQLIARGVTNVVFDPTITRGFDYYTGIIFEFFDTNPTNPRSLFGGGRYDRLVAIFGNKVAPAVGFGMGDVVLADFLSTHKLALDTRSALPQIYFGTPKSSDIPAAQALAQKVRAKGYSVFVNLMSKALGDQVRDAVRRGIPFFVAYGTDELISNTLRLKILATGEEFTTTIETLAAHLKKCSEMQ